MLKKGFRFGANPDDGAGFGSTTVLNVNLKMLKHGEQNKVCVSCILLTFLGKSSWFSAG